MKKSEVIQLDVELNTQNLTASVSNANRLLEMLGNTAKDVGNTMEDALRIDTNSLEGLLTGINTMAQDLGTVADKMGEIAQRAYTSLELKSKNGYAKIMLIENNA